MKANRVCDFCGAILVYPEIREIALMQRKDPDVIVDTHYDRDACVKCCLKIEQFCRRLEKAKANKKGTE